ncbi:acyl-CoA dehydrogenase family protein [Deinococcus roseus]|uniref:Acyl-CoA dehydrogenase n=1 Tax=Deinococcus roseus TaxID=392414 RepID=A0ABQ2DFL3_9DEIO|nr:acyl-CoA dehydrogenase family protein [Deinococcus roseus]GGJ52748.1 acyl-CoA dehydrogenase [Deinococcus roseus]
MRLPLSEPHLRQFQAFQAFTSQHITPHAGAWDRAQYIPESLISLLGQHGYLGANVPEQSVGQGWDSLTYGLLHEAIGAGCSSVRSLLTVHGMACHATARWATRSVREQVLPRLACGDLIGAFALSEATAGSDAQNVQLMATRQDNHYLLNGTKQWITFGQRADVFVVFGRMQQGHTAFLVDRDTPGLSIEPLSDLLGTRASMLARLHFQDARVPAEHLLGREGFGHHYVLTSTLDWGRFSVAWGSVGILQAALDTVLEHTRTREQYGSPLASHQLVQRHLTEMAVKLHSARLLCYQAALSRDRRDPQHLTDTLLAKYQASNFAAEAAHTAVHLLGAKGCLPDFPAERLWRDAKVAEIIEGTPEILQMQIARQLQDGYGQGIFEGAL